MAVISEAKQFGQRVYLHTFSDRGMKIHCIGDPEDVNYNEAVDLLDTSRVYVETEIPVSVFND